MDVVRRLRRRLWSPVSVAACSGCGVVLRERRRRPCPICGGMSRTVSIGLDDAVTVDVRQS